MSFLFYPHRICIFQSASMKIEFKNGEFNLKNSKKLRQIQESNKRKN